MLPLEPRLDLVSKLYQESIWDDVLRVSRGASLKRPLVVELDPTSFCDLACAECISSPLLNQSRFGADRLVQLAEEIVNAGVRAVILIGGGEPLLHPATARVLRKFGQAGLSIGITTNGTLIHRHFDVLSENATWTRVSVDAASPATYKTFRPARSGRNAFPGVIENMRRLSRLKQGTLGYSYLLLARRKISGEIENNFGEVFAAGVLAKEIGCDYFEVKPSYDMGHYLINQSLELIDRAAAQIAALAEIADQNFRVLAPRNLEVILRQLSPKEPKVYERCYVSELRTLITPKGAYVCPYHRGEESCRYGDATNTSFAELWNAPRRLELMAKLKPSQHCQFHCIRHRTNQELIKIGKSPDSHPRSPDYDLFL